MKLIYASVELICKSSTVSYISLLLQGWGPLCVEGDTELE
jgi:hypothetical protein